MATKSSKRSRNTANAGAAAIIKQVIRKIGQMQRQSRDKGFDIPHLIDGYTLADWLRDWDKRAQSRPGGLGRAKAKGKGGK